MHYVMDDLEVDFLLDAVDFIADYGRLFLPLYDFDINDGSWNKSDDPTRLQRFSLEAALEAKMGEETPMPFEERQRCYASYLEQALKLAQQLQKNTNQVELTLEGKLGELQFFSLPECCMGTENKKNRKGFMGKLKTIFDT
jgi:hypothetical protein